jgi:hypothetical protein
LLSEQRSRLSADPRGHDILPIDGWLRRLRQGLRPIAATVIRDV